MLNSKQWRVIKLGCKVQAHNPMQRSLIKLQRDPSSPATPVTPQTQPSLDPLTSHRAKPMRLPCLLSILTIKRFLVSFSNIKSLRATNVSAVTQSSKTAVHTTANIELYQ